mgnify:CR=1 FL=1
MVKTMKKFLDILDRIEVAVASLVLAVLILAETGIHGIVSITDNGTANRDIYVESEQEVCGLLESAGVD